MNRKYWQLLFDAAQAMRDCATAQCDTRLDKVTLAQEKIFRVVFSHPEGLKLKDIANKLGLTPGAVSQSIEHLVREGMLERVTNPEDRRAVSIRTTAKSERYIRLNQENFSKIMADAMRECGQPEREAYVRIMENVVEKAREARARIKPPCDAIREMEKHSLL